MNKKNFKTVTIILIVILGASKSFADNIKGVISRNDSSIKYEVDIETGEYLLDFENSIHNHLFVSKKDMEGLDCKQQEILVEEGGKDLPMDFFLSKKNSRVLQLSVSDLNLNRKSIELLIQRDLGEKGYKVKDLESRTDFFIQSLELQMNWNDSSLVGKLGEKFAQRIFEEVKNDLNSDSVLSSLNASGRAKLKTISPLLVCDLFEKSLTMQLRVNFLTEHSKKKSSPISFQQMKKLNQDLISKKDLIVKANDVAQSDGLYSDREIQKAINAAAVYAITLNKMGFDLSFISHEAFYKLFGFMFSNSELMPKSLSDLEMKDLESHLSQMETVSKKESQSKYEVLPLEIL